MLAVVLKGVIAEMDSQEYRKGHWYGWARQEGGLDLGGDMMGQLIDKMEPAWSRANQKAF